MSDKKSNATNNNAKPEELVDRDLDQAAGGNFEEVKVTFKDSGSKQDSGKGSKTVSSMDLGSGR